MAKYIRTVVRDSQLPEGVFECRKFQRRVWLFQRGAWVIFAIILIACLLGLFGKGGVLSRGHIEADSGAIDYPALSRWSARDQLRLVLKPSSADQSLVVDAAFLDTFTVEGIDPPPRSVFVKAGLIHYIFQPDTEPRRVIFRLAVEAPGLHRPRIGLDRAVFQRSIFIFP